MQREPSLEMYWIPDSISNILHANGIHTRDQLANALPVDRATVFRAFPTDTYSGRVRSTKMLVAMAQTFRVPLNRLVVEPAAQTSPRSRKLS